MHAGACGCEKETGDGAGMLLAIPDKLYRKVCSFELPAIGSYSAGIVFFPKDQELIARHKQVLLLLPSEAHFPRGSFEIRQ